MKALPGWRNVPHGMKKKWSEPFKVEYMKKLPHLDQPMGNNECGFYVMWAMLAYFGAKVGYGDPMVRTRLILILLFCLTYVHINIILYQFTAQSSRPQQDTRF